MDIIADCHGLTKRALIDAGCPDTTAALPHEPHEPPHWMRVPIELLVLACLVVGTLPQWSIQGVLSAAAAPVVGGKLPVFDLAVWHGFNLPLGMSVLALAGGIGLYLLLRLVMGAQASNDQFEKIKSYLAIGREEGAKVLTGGESVDLGGDLSGGYYIAPTVFEGKNSMRIFQEEIFGPVVSLTSFGDQAEALAAYAAKDVKVSDADLQDAYQKNIEQFKTPASATVDEASFKDQGQANAFRADWNGQGDFTSAATKAGATVSERGSVTSGDQKLDAELDKAVQGTGLRAVGDGSLTPVVKVGERYSVAYVRDLKKATTRPLGEVKAQLEPQVLNEKQTAAMQAFFDKQLKELKPTDNLQKILDEQTKRVTAAEKAAGTTTTPATPQTTPATPPAGDTSDK